MNDPKPSDALVLFGATGDLAYKKLFPTLHSLVSRGVLDVPIIGVAKSSITQEDLRKRCASSIHDHSKCNDEEALEKLLGLLQYVDGDYNDKSTFENIRKLLGDAARPLHYLAIPPTLFKLVTEHLGESGCARGARVVIEKPFGENLETAMNLNNALHAVLPEESIYRIDHYLGKEAIQDILYFRFGNTIFEPVWNRTYIDNVQITMAEDFGVEDRGRFYDATGAIRDVMQNHLLKVVGYLAMEPTRWSDTISLHDESLKVLRAIRPLTPDCVSRGQSEGFTSIDGVDPDSTTETYAALKLYIDNWRWDGVPFYLRAGKNMPDHSTEVRVEFRRPPRVVFDETNIGEENFVRFRIFPKIGIDLGARTKQPGEAMVGRNIQLTALDNTPDKMSAYERLIGDAIEGDSTLFATQQEVDAAWRIFDPIVGNVVPVQTYQRGTWGPDADDAITPDDGWHDPAT